MKKWKSKKVILIGLLMCMISLIIAFSESVSTIKIVLFGAVLVVAGFIDFKTRTIPDWIHVLVIMIAFIGIDLMDSLTGLLIVPFPYLMMAFLKENSIGGGDVKLMGACGFYLGLQAGCVASILGLVLAIIGHFVCRVIFGKMLNKSIPLAPYLGAGCLIAHFIVK
ncbi:prepilin peptidase [Fusibacter ferrireducens]|uniref:Prepilin peptidase n=1 Tax=Fusibacter ferrireducens TaxID=2785058 RepID=A0ABR9ZPN7_9FIRM|nr:A24 family peptidase [Fusibacter ferrireducens]MBF4692286.1 prepilin peptidase [Fusibacter ferrireducens]